MELTGRKIIIAKEAIAEIAALVLSAEACRSSNGSLSQQSKCSAILSNLENRKTTFALIASQQLGKSESKTKLKNQLSLQRWEN